MLARVARAARSRAGIAAGAAILYGFLVAAAAQGATLFDPAHHYRSIATAHFVIYFHQGEDAMAARLAGIAEETWTRLAATFETTPPARTRVVLADDSELANGAATPVPYDIVVVTATWPGGAESIGNEDDWLRLVFAHEFTHIVHLDRSRGWARVVRDLFGRHVIAFPNLFLPEWQIEGLATYEESAATGAGRLHAGDFRAIVGEAARAGRLEPLDRVNGGLTDWPGGNAEYAYGLGFHAYLAERYGSDSLARLADATAGRVPYTASPVFRRVYGKSLGDLWREYESSERSEAARGEPVESRAIRLTHHGFDLAGPRFAPPACPTCPARIVYSLRTPHAFPTINAVDLDGSHDAPLARRFLGSTSAATARTIYFDQQELRRETGLYGDLYALDRESGRVTALTRESRLLDPDLSPDGRTLAAVHDHDGQRDLVLVRLPNPNSQIPNPNSEIPNPDVLAAAPETQFNAPRWSPDGRAIAVERHVSGRRSEVVIVDVTTRAIQVVASAPRARFVTPAWRPGGRAIVVSGAPDDRPFNLVEIEIDADRAPIRARQLTHTTGGATWPDVSSDGSTIVFVSQTAGGFDLFTIPYPESAGGVGQGLSPVPQDSAPASSGARQDLSPGLQQSAAAPSHVYSPWPTLRPTSWSPIVTGDANQLRVGAATGGSDVLGYHAYALSATWLATHPAGAPTPNAATPDWAVSYAYDRWRPVLSASASTDTSFFAGPPTANGLASAATKRERQLSAGIEYPVTHVRVTQAAFASIVRAADDFTLPDGVISRNRTALRAAWAIETAHTYGYSISPEGGVLAGATAEIVRRAIGASADATAVTGDLRGYLPSVAPHHVIALRAAGASATGDPTMTRFFDLGGAAPNVDPIDFGDGAFSLLRGFPTDTFAGTHVAVANLDYRFPIARPQRGVGTWPVFLHTIHAAVFVDAGNAWVRRFDLHDLKSSAGAELSTDLIAGYVLPLTITAGAARTHDGSHLVADGWSGYLRVGRAF